MRYNSKYDMSGTSYLQSMDEKTTRYSNLVRKAERVNRDRSGKPSKQEAEFYYEASVVCEEIMNMNLSQRAVYEQWKQRKLECEDNLRRITDILAPPPPPAPVEEPVVDQVVQKVRNTRKQDSAPETVTDSETGFSTKFATKEVPFEKIKSWIKDIPDQGFEQVIGRTKLKQELLLAASNFGWQKTDSVLDMNPVNCFFLYGPPGTGKTHMINAFAGELKKRAAESGEKEFTYLQLTGSDIHESLVGVAEKVVKTVFEVAQEHEPCLVFIDEIDNVCVRRDEKAEGHERRLTVEFMQAYNKFKKSGKRVVFMGATNHPGKVDEAMLDRCSLIRVPLPEEEDRDIFFSQMLEGNKKKAEVAKLNLESGFTTAEMAEATDNHSYRDLERLKESMLIKVKKQAIEEYRVLDENGNVDQKASDEQVSNAILEGKILITRAMFEQAQEENPPSDKSESRQELKEFEKRVMREVKTDH